jgi:hypothetical protein
MYERVRENQSCTGGFPTEPVAPGPATPDEGARSVGLRDALHQRVVDVQPPAPGQLGQEGGGAIAEALVGGVEQRHQDLGRRAQGHHLAGDHLQERVGGGPGAGDQERGEPRQGLLRQARIAARRSITRTSND